MAVAFDAQMLGGNKSSSGSTCTAGVDCVEDFTSGGTTINITSAMTVGTGSNRALFVMVMPCNNSTNSTVSSVTWDSGGTNQALSLVTGTRKSITYSNGDGASEIWVVAAPVSGTKTLQVVLSQATTETYINAISFTGVNQSTPSANGTNGGTAGSGTPSLVVTTSSSNAQVCTFNSNVIAFTTLSSTAGTPTTVYADNNSGTFTSGSSGYNIGGAASVTLTMGGGTGTWEGSACDVVASGAAAQNPFIPNPDWFDLPPNDPYLNYISKYRTWCIFKFPTATVRTNFLNYDFPNPRAPQRLADYVWIESGNNFPPFPTVKTTFQQTDWPLPSTGPQRLIDYFWPESGNVQIPFPTIKTTFQQNDWPLPNIGPQRLNDYTWIESGNAQPPFPNLATPINQLDWPNPYPVYWYRTWEKWKQQTPTVKTTFQQNDWPNPKPIYWYLDHSQNLVITIPIAKNPFNQYSWPVPPPVTWYESHTFGPQPTPTVLNTVLNFDFPNPQPLYWYRDWFNIPPKVVAPMPFSQSDWPNPLPINWYEWWYNTQPFGTIQTPAAQYDWPNPPPLYWYRDANQNLVLFLPPPSQPFSQTDWPLPKDYQRIDESFWQSLASILPPPPPPPLVISSGRQLTEQEVLRSWMKAIGKIGRAVRYNTK